jgi:hypothetical protein
MKSRNIKSIKNRVLLFFLLLQSSFLYCLETIHVAPFYHIDEVKDEVHPNNDFHRRLFNKLQSIETGIDLIFSLSSLGRGQNPPQSLSDAIRVCQNEHANYLLYGYVATKDYTVYAEIKLLDYSKRSLISTFYSVDDLNNIERLLDDLSIKILSFVEETFNISILDHPPAFTEWSTFAKLGYWSPMGEDWTRLLIGTAVADFGLWFTPTDRLDVKYGYLTSFSLGFDLSYAFALGTPDRYDAYDHIISIGLPVKLNIKLNSRHGLYTGAGLLYIFDLLYFNEPYDDSVLKVYRCFAASAFLGYDFKIKENLSLTVDNQFEFRFQQHLMPVFFLRIGIDYRFSKKEVLQKW